MANREAPGPARRWGVRPGPPTDWYSMRPRRAVSAIRCRGAGWLRTGGEGWAGPCVGGRGERRPIGFVASDGAEMAGRLVA